MWMISQETVRQIQSLNKTMEQRCYLFKNIYSFRIIFPHFSVQISVDIVHAVFFVNYIIKPLTNRPIGLFVNHVEIRTDKNAYN